MGKVHASLFSGFGAADLAATWMGWDNAFWCEIDDFPRTVLSYWFPKSKRYGNIKETDFTPWRGKIDVLTGGFPCQPFSVAGQRKGQDDDRYLWPEMLRAIREIRPTWIIGENVGGILSMVQPGSEITVESQASLFEEADKETLLDQDSVVGTVCRDLEQEGYSVQPVVIPACAVGAPHRRNRIFFIAYRSDAGVESLQQGGENGVSGFRTTSYTNSTGRIQFGNRGDISNEKQYCSDKKLKRCEQSVRVGRCDKAQAFANSDNNGLYGSKNGQSDRKGNDSDPSGQDAIKQFEGCGCKADVTNPNGQKLQARLKARRRQNSAKIGTRLDNGTERFGGLRYASYAHQFNGHLSGLCSGGISQLQTSGVRIDTDTYDKRFTEQRLMSESDKPGFSCGLCYEAGTRKDWRDFPTKPPVCRGNDGLPFDVVRLTISLTAWCTGSIKGYGNAIVPQVMYEIFKAIEESEK